MAQEIDQLDRAPEEVSLLARLWRAILVFFSTGSFDGDNPNDEEREQLIEELNISAEERRRRYLSCFNQIVSHRLNAEALAAVSPLLTAVAAGFDDLAGRLETLQQSSAGDSRRLSEEQTELDAELKDSRLVGGNTMRRNVTADYVEQYLQLRFKRAEAALLEWLWPENESAVAGLESRYEIERIRARYADHYAADLLRREDRDSLAKMIERLRSAQTNGSLSSRIGALGVILLARAG